MRTFKKIAAVLAVLLVLAFAGAIAVGYFQLDYNSGADYQALDKTVNATLTEDGQLLIEETIHYSFKKRDRPHYNPYRLFKTYDVPAISDMEVYDHDQQLWYTFNPDHSYGAGVDTAEPNTCYVVENYSEWEIGFIMPALEKGERTFTIWYTLEGFTGLESYDDADVLYYQFQPTDLYPIRNFTLNLSFPANAADSLAWLHCTADSFLALNDDSSLTVTASKVPASVFIELRLLMPPGSLWAAGQYHDYSGAGIIRTQEAEWADGWALTTRYRWATAVFSIAIAVAMFLLACYTGFRTSRVREAAEPALEDCPYQRQPPYGMSAATAQAFLKRAVFRDSKLFRRTDSDGDMLSASTLSLAHKGWLTLTANAAGEPVVTYLGTGGTPPNTEEAHLLQLYYQAALAHGGGFTLRQYASWYEKNIAKLSTHMSQYFSTLDKAVRATNWSITRPFFSTLAGRMCVLCAAAALVLLIFLDFFGRGVLVGGLLLSAVAFLLYSRPELPSESGVQALTAWKGFYRFLRDFTILDERSAPEVSLWGDYLVYATAFGLGDAVSGQMQALSAATRTGAPQDTASQDPLFVYFPHSTWFNTFPESDSPGRSHSSPSGGSSISSL
ncbi:DUF2207 domain-containing protein, partial [Ruminococcaceae bacterium OttesenSCG-928-D13]|nr:DUF2207 domain-containing protein [Ruminococcaceae bacterium OttesenSCG-928-D13]